MRYNPDMAKTLYSAEEVAGILGLHVRTVRGYVRDGSLPATRIGKQYRITRSDLDAFTGTPPSSATGPATGPAGHPDGPPRVEVSAVVQVEPLAPGALTRLSSLVASIAAAQPGRGSPLHVQTVYDEQRASLKIVVIGAASDVAAALTLINSVAGEQGPAASPPG
jgi:excisionase family DNA binding protein